MTPTLASRDSNSENHCWSLLLNRSCGTKMATRSDWMTSAASANRHIVVADSSHYIQVERSQVVVDAIEQARDAVRNRNRRYDPSLHASQRLSGSSAVITPEERRSITAPPPLWSALARRRVSCKRARSREGEKPQRFLFRSPGS